MYNINELLKTFTLVLLLTFLSSNLLAERRSAVGELEINTTAQGEVSINWTSQGEQLSEYFAVERSDDGTVWWKIGEVHPLENITITKSYEFIDETPMNGVSFYRVKSIMENGDRFNAAPEMVYFEFDDKIKIIPDSRNKELNIYLKGSILKDMQLFGPSGMPIQVDYIREPYAGKFDTTKLNPGKYNLTIITDVQTINRQIIII